MSRVTVSHEMGCFARTARVMKFSKQLKYIWGEVEFFSIFFKFMISHKPAPLSVRLQKQYHQNSKKYFQAFLILQFYHFLGDETAYFQPHKLSIQENTQSTDN